MMKCSRCNGTGQLRVDEPECNGGITSVECERCKGAGWVRIETSAIGLVTEVV
jgi:hypothetical protein